MKTSLIREYLPTVSKQLILATVFMIGSGLASLALAEGESGDCGSGCVGMDGGRLIEQPSPPREPRESRRCPTCALP